MQITEDATHRYDLSGVTSVAIIRHLAAPSYVAYMCCVVATCLACYSSSVRCGGLSLVIAGPSSKFFSIHPRMDLVTFCA